MKEKEHQKEQTARQHLQEARQERVNRLPVEVPAGVGIATIQIRFPDGSKLTRRFSGEQKIQTIYDFVEIHLLEITLSKEEIPTDFQLSVLLSTHYPKKTLNDRDQTVKEADLIPQSLLFISL